MLQCADNESREKGCTWNEKKHLVSCARVSGSNPLDAPLGRLSCSALGVGRSVGEMGDVGLLADSFIQLALLRVGRALRCSPVCRILCHSALSSRDAALTSSLLAVIVAGARRDGDALSASSSSSLSRDTVEPPVCMKAVDMMCV
jgi:hypothetical protein